ncbi:hypothetical protein CPAV1605_1548 [seawater metagenome]|uniref:Uncharacterized protein n=1 Tax=seawater metagenome TaxID=1561972 RepID=A0A5E8CME1_9ZZZZ
MSYLNALDIQEIEWDVSLSNILKDTKVTKEQIFHPNETIIKLIKINNKVLFQALKKEKDELVVDIDENNNIECGHINYLANIILGYKEIIVCNSNENCSNESEYDNESTGSNELFFHFDSDGNPDESNDVWEYGDAYHLSQS